MAAELDRAKDLFDWNARVFGIVGAWPLHSTFVKCIFWIAYMLVHNGALFADFVDIFGNLELMILNVGETTWGLMTLSKVLVMRFSRNLPNLTKRVIDSIDRKNFDSNEEVDIYMNYNRLAKGFFKMWFTIGISSSVVYNLKPLTYRVRAGLWNESTPFVLSYRTRFFFEINDSRTFWLVWLFQIPVTCFNLTQYTALGFLYALILHVSGELTILALRIRNIGLNSSEDNEAKKIVFHDTVNRHLAVIGMVDDIDEVFGLVHLEELVIMTLLLGLSAYKAIVSMSVNSTGETAELLLYSVGLLFMMYGYCLAGEHLVDASTNFYEAYYECKWYCMSESFKKCMVICMVGASRPAHLTAGGFYHFSLEGFTKILKTAAGYISLFRTMV